MAGFSSLQDILIYNLLDKEFLSRSVSFPEEIDEIPENMKRFCRLIPEDLKIQIRPVLKEFQRCVEAQQVFLETAEKYPQLAFFLIDKFHISVNADAAYACFAYAVNNENYEIISRLNYCMERLDANHVSKLLMLGMKKGNKKFFDFLLGRFFQFMDMSLFRELLNRASDEGKFEIFRELIEAFIYTRYLSREDHFMFLHNAAKSGNSDFLRYLVETFHLDLASEEGRETVSWAALSGNIDLMKWLIKDLHIDPMSYVFAGQTLLYFAVQSGSLGMVKYLVEQCGLEIKDEIDERSILNCAYEGGNFEVFCYLYHNPKISITNRDVKVYAILRSAATDGNAEFFQNMAEKLELDINFIDEDGNSLLFHAIESKSVGLVRYLLLCPRLSDKIIQEAVMVERFWEVFLPKVTSNNEEIVELVRFLVERRNLDVNCVTPSGCSLLDMALLAGCVELVAYLFSFPGLDPARIESLMTKPDFSVLLLEQAAKNRKLFEFVRILIERYRIDLKFFEAVKGENTFLAGALFYGFKYNYLGLFKYLIEVCHLDVNQGDQSGRTALLLYAAQAGNLEAVKYLVENCNIDINALDHEGRSVLAFDTADVSRKSFNVELVKYLIECPQLSNKIYCLYFTRLVRIICRYCSLSLLDELMLTNMRLLFENCGFDGKLFINEENKTRTFLQLVLYLSEDQYFTVFEYLVRNFHFDVNFANQEGLTIFHSALLLGNWKLIYLLDEVYQDKINFNAVDQQGRTVAHCAAIGGSVGYLHSIFARGVRFEVNSCDNKGFTPLHYAAQRGNLLDVQYLIEMFKANKDIVSSVGGVTVFQLACESGDQDLIEYLKSINEPCRSASVTPIIEEEEEPKAEEESKELKQEPVAMSAERETFIEPEVTVNEDVFRADLQAPVLKQPQKSSSLSRMCFLPAITVIGALLGVSAILLNSNEN